MSSQKFNNWRLSGVAAPESEGWTGCYKYVGGVFAPHWVKSGGGVWEGLCPSQKIFDLFMWKLDSIVLNSGVVFTESI